MGWGVNNNGQRLGGTPAQFFFLVWTSLWTLLGFFRFFGGCGQQSLLGLQYCAVMDVVRNIVNVYKKILKCSQKCLL